jgi:hypothetical protein
MRECTRRLAENVVRATRINPETAQHISANPEKGINTGKAMYHRFYGKKD